MKITLDLTENELKRLVTYIRGQHITGNFDPAANPLDNTILKCLVGGEKYFEKVGLDFATIFTTKKDDKK